MSKEGRERREEEKGMVREGEKGDSNVEKGRKIKRKECREREKD